MTDLPEPDSPTMPSTSPWFMLKDTPFSAFDLARGGEEGQAFVLDFKNFFSLMLLLLPSLALELRVKRIAQTVAEQVEKPGS